MKVAIFYDWINQWGGAEKVLISILKLYPKATVFTLVHDKAKTPWLPKKTRVTTSFINEFPYAKGNPIIYTPLYDIATEQFNLSDYDIVISTTSTIGHSLITSPKTAFICYFHNVNRYLYNTPQNLNFITPLLNIYKKIDFAYSRRPDAILCNSKTVFDRIHKQYGLNSKIINPGVDTHFFTPSGNSENFYLTVSRLVPHKNIDIVINYFKKTDKNLIIVGSGRQEKHLKELSKRAKNIKFVGQVSDIELLKYYQQCIALICPQLEDFGLSAIEAQACGKPVIAYGKGGNTETILNNKTGIFFNKPTSKSLSVAIKKFKKLNIKSRDCIQNANKFSEESFMLNFKESICNIWLQKQTTT